MNYQAMRFEVGECATCNTLNAAGGDDEFIARASDHSGQRIEPIATTFRMIRSAIA